MSSNRPANSRYVLFAAYCVAVLLVMIRPVRELMAFASDWDNTNASHILLIPFISAFLLFLNRKEIFEPAGPGSRVAIAGFVPAIAMFVLGTVWGPRLVEGDRLALIASGIVLLWISGFAFFFGFQAARRAIFPLLFLFFCLPIPSVIQDTAISILQRGSTEFSYLLIKFTGTPIFRQGFMFTLPNITVEVAPQCSGIRSGISLFILSTVAGHVLLRSTWRWLVLLVAILPILFLKNALRITTLAWLSVHVDRNILNSRLHSEGGVGFFFLGLLMIYPVLALLAKSEGKPARGLTREVEL